MSLMVVEVGIQNVFNVGVKVDRKYLKHLGRSMDRKYL